MSCYTIFITPDGLAGIKALPADLRQRARRFVSALAGDPAPPDSRALDPDDLRFDPGRGRTIRCLRMESGRIVYAVSEAKKIVDVLAVRSRPPYDYDYLKQLMAKIK